MSMTRPSYPSGFREQMVELVRSGRSPEELAREFEPPAQSIRNWVGQADRDEGRGDGGLTSGEREELRRLSGISKSQVARLFTESDDKIRSFLERPLEGEWPYLWLDATYVKVRQAGRIVSVALTVAVAVNDRARREVLGMGIGASEAEAFSGPSSCAPSPGAGSGPCNWRSPTTTRAWKPP